MDEISAGEGGGPNGLSVSHKHCTRHKRSPTNEEPTEER